MIRRYAIAILLVCAVLFLMGTLAIPAAAQAGQPEQAALWTPRDAVSDLLVHFQDADRPAHVLGLEGPSRLAVGEEGLFVASANVETAAFPLRFRWDFGDGTTAHSLSARHTYTEPGTYTVTFTAYNDNSADTDSLTVTVVAPVRGIASSGANRPGFPV